MKETHIPDRREALPLEDPEGTPRRVTRRPRSRRDPPVQNRFWPITAVLAMMVAVAGWTTAAMLVLTRPAVPAASAEPTVAAGLPAASPADTARHDVPALEQVLPTSWNGTALTTTSWTGSAILSDDDWSKAVTAYLASIKRKPDDLKIAQAYDPLGSMDLAAVAFQVDGVDSAKLLQAIIGAWRVNYPGLVTTTATIGGKSVVRGVFPEQPIASYWYQARGVAFEVDTSDPSVAAGILGMLP